MTGEDYSLLGLFFSAFLSSTILPGSSEVLLVALATHGDVPYSNLLAVATAGNTLGGMTFMGIGLDHRVAVSADDIIKGGTSSGGRARATVGEPDSALILGSRSWATHCVWQPDGCGFPGLAHYSLLAVGKAIRYWALLALLPSSGT